MKIFNYRLLHVNLRIGSKQGHYLFCYGVGYPFFISWSLRLLPWFKFRRGPDPKSYKWRCSPQ